MAGWTNRGKFRMLDWIFRGTAKPTNFYIVLCTSAFAPTADTNVKSELTEIAAGNGYAANGMSLSPGAVDFDVITENDTSDLGIVQLKDIVWTAAGGPIPASGNGARWAVLTDDNATPANREVLAYWDLVADRSVSVGQSLTLQNCQLDLREA